MIKRFCIAIVCLASCVSPTKEDLEVIQSLNQQYPQYEFSQYTNHVIPNYLQVRSKNENVDSVQLRKIYSTIRSNDRTPWSYLIIYDKQGEYLFTVSGHGKEITFFKDDVQ